MGDQLIEHGIRILGRHFQVEQYQEARSVVCAISAAGGATSGPSAHFLATHAARFAPRATSWEVAVSGQRSIGLSSDGSGSREHLGLTVVAER